MVLCDCYRHNQYTEKNNFIRDFIRMPIFDQREIIDKNELIVNNATCMRFGNWLLKKGQRQH